ncbi:MAG: hypothetical protein DRO05_08305 [Thermoproteota archaeon]|nr:MAG: hypothetical protein DRO05_08305 [Candidatus Korarchaeota archaeon]
MKGLKMLRLLTSLAFLALILSFVLKRADLCRLLESMGKIRAESLLLTSFLSVLAVMSSTLRWHLLLSGLRKTPFKNVLFAMLSGYYLLLILPYGTGHIAKVGLVGGDYCDAAGSLMLGMIFETLILALLLSFNLHNKCLPLIFVGVLFLPILGKKVYERERLLARIREFCDRIPMLGGLLVTLGRDIETLGEDLLSFLLLILLSILSLFAQLCGIWVLVHSLGYNLGIGELSLAFASSVFLGLIGGTPGGLGGNEFGLAIALERSGIPLESSLSIALVFKTLFQYAYAPIGGIIFHLRVGVRD